MPADTKEVIEVVAEGGATPRPTRQPNVRPSPSSRPIASRPSAPAARTSSGRDASANPYEDYGRRNQQILADARKRREEELRREAARAEAEKAAAEKANAQPVEKVLDPYASTGRVTRSGSGAAAADASVGVRPSGTALVDPYAVASASAPAAPSHDTPPRAPKPTANWRSMGEFYPANADELVVFDSQALPFRRELAAPWEHYPFARLPRRDFTDRPRSELRRDMLLMSSLRGQNHQVQNECWSAYARLPSSRPMRHFRVPHTLCSDRTFLLHPGDALYVERMNRRLFQEGSYQGSVADMPMIRSRWFAYPPRPDTGSYEHHMRLHARVTSRRMGRQVTANDYRVFAHRHGSSAEPATRPMKVAREALDPLWDDPTWEGKSSPPMCLPVADPPSLVYFHNSALRDAPEWRMDRFRSYLELERDILIGIELARTAETRGFVPILEEELLNRLNRTWYEFVVVP